MAGSGTIWLPVAPSFRGFGAQVVKEAAGAARQAGDKLDSELGAAGKRAGQAAGKGMADGVRSSAAQVEKATAQVVQARKREADAAANVALAEARLADARAKGSNPQTIAKNEAALESARRRQESAARQLTASEGDLDSIRKGEPGRAQSVIRTSSQVEAARLRAADASDKVRLAEQRVEEVQSKGNATAVEVARAQGNLTKARSEQISAVDTLRAKEELHSATSADANDKTRELGNTSKTAGEKVRGMAGGLSNAAEKAKGYALGVVGAIGIMGKIAFSAASEAQQATGAVESVFAQHAGVVQDYASQAAQNVGLATSEYGQLSAVLGAQMKNLGVPMDKLAGETNNLISIGADMAAAFGGTTQQAVEALGSALRGERDPIERYGVSLTQASIDAWKAKNGMDGLSGAADQNANLMATLALITEQTASVQGQFGREADTAAGQQQRATAEFENAKIAIGTGLLPVVTKAAQTFAGLARILGEHPAVVLVVAGVIGTLALAVLAINTATTIYSAVTSAAAIATWKWTASLLANPITWVVVGIAALVAGLYLFFTKTETGRKAWEGFMGVLRKAGGFFKDLVALGKTVIDVLFKGDYGGAPFGIEEDSGVVDFLFRLRDAAIATWDIVKTAFTTGAAVVSAVFTGVATVVKWIGAVFAAVFLGGVLIAWNALSAGLSAVWNGLIKPVFDGWAIIAQWLWTSVLQPVFGWIQAGWSMLGTALQVVYMAVVKPVFDWLGAAAMFVWTSILMPTFNAIKVGFQAVGSFFLWVWTSVIKPAWDALGAGIRWGWESVIRPTWDGLKAALGAVGAFFQSVWANVIKPAWDALGAGIRAVIDGVIIPAWEVLKSGLSSVQSFFSTVVDGIGRVWDAMKGHVARPINFVIDTVWNNGLLKAWNTIAGFLPGLPTAAPLSPVAFAEGGPVPMTPGAKRGKDSVHALMMPNEHVLDVNNVRNAGGHGQIYQMRSMIDRGVPFTWVNGRVVPAGHGLEPTQRFAEGGEVKGSRLSPSPGEGGLEPIAVLAKRLIHRIWPDITEIGGYRQDAYEEHPSGRALDVMVGVGNPAGDEVTSWALANDKILPLIHALWKQTVWMPNGSTQPMGDRGSPTQNHMDHPHLWYQPKNVDPNVVPEGLVGHDGLNRDDRLGIIKTKISEILDKALDPIKEGISRVVGDPPPELLGIPPIALDETKNAALDGAFSFAENIAGDLKEVYNKAKDVVTSVTGLFRDEGGYIPNGKSIVNNETGKPEAVFNWKQVEQLSEILNSVRDLDHLWAILGEMGHTMTTGDYRGRMHGLTGLDEDSELVHALVSVNEGLDQFGEHVAGVLEAAGTKALKGYGDSALDFFGFGELASAGAEIFEAFNKPPESQGGATTGAASAIATAGPTSAGGGIVTHGDPNAVYETREVALETAMPDLDRANPPGTGAERWRSMMIDALKNQGLDEWANNPAIVDRFIRQIDTESGGDPNIAQQIVDVNGTGESAGVGLGQAIPSTWAAYRDPSLPDDRRNGWAMLNFMARYVSQKYGPQGYERIGNGVGYDRGGLANDLGFMAKYTLRPERVLSPSQTEAFESWMDAGTPDGKLEVLNGLPSSADFEALASRFSQENDENSPGWGRGGPLVNIERLEARDEEEAMRKVHRETRRASRSAGLGGGYA